MGRVRARGCSVGFFPVIRPSHVTTAVMPITLSSIGSTTSPVATECVVPSPMPFSVSDVDWDVVDGHYRVRLHVNGSSYRTLQL